MISKKDPYGLVSVSLFQTDEEYLAHVSLFAFQEILNSLTFLHQFPLIASLEKSPYLLSYTYHTIIKSVECSPPAINPLDSRNQIDQTPPDLPQEHFDFWTTSLFFVNLSFGILIMRLLTTFQTRGWTYSACSLQKNLSFPKDSSVKYVHNFSQKNTKALLY